MYQSFIIFIIYYFYYFYIYIISFILSFVFSIVFAGCLQLWEQSCSEKSSLNVNHCFRQRHQIDSNTSAFLNANVILSLLANSYKRPKDDKRCDFVKYVDAWSIETLQTLHSPLPASSLHFKTNPQAINHCQNMKVQTRVSCGVLPRVGVWCLLSVL